MAEQKSSHSGSSERLADWVDRLSRLYTPVVADVLDRLGYRDQCLRAEIRPLVAGYAAGRRGADRPDDPRATDLTPAEPYKGEMAAVDALGPGRRDGRVDVRRQLLGRAAVHRGAVPGLPRRRHRRLHARHPGHQDHGLPGLLPGHPPGRQPGPARRRRARRAHRLRGRLRQARDLVLADDDGVVVVPQAVAEQALAAAEQKVRGENLVRLKLAEGMTVTEAFRRYGVL